MNNKTITVESMFASIGDIEIDFEQVGCKTIWANEQQVYKQIGNSVCVPVVRRIAKNIVES